MQVAICFAPQSAWHLLKRTDRDVKLALTLTSLSTDGIIDAWSLLLERIAVASNGLLRNWRNVSQRIPGIHSVPADRRIVLRNAVVEDGTCEHRIVAWAAIPDGDSHIGVRRLADGLDLLVTLADDVVCFAVWRSVVHFYAVPHGAHKNHSLDVFM